jgi:hypothetical protein
MAPQTTPVVVSTAQRLQVWLEGATSLNDALHVVYLWAQEAGARRSSAGVSGNVYLTNDVVVKAHYTIDSFDNIPEEYRPEQITVWQGDWPSERIVVQPRYERLVEGEFEPTSTELDAAEARITALLGGESYWVVADSHLGNWGLRPDGSPVLFDW